MSKRGIIFTLVLVFTQCVMASVVTPEDAARYAGKFMGMSSAPVPDNASMQRSAIRGGTQGPEYYVFNNPDGGWVIIAADDRITPILAYSESGRFDSDAEMPDNLSSWMNDVSQTIDAVRNSNAVASAQVSAAWSALRGAGANQEGTKKEIETAKWDQNAPYNNLCPIVTGETKHSAAGCVATAMAIVMRHNRWPETGTGTIGGYTTPSRFYRISPYSIEEREYNWNKMPLTNGAQAGWTADEKQEVAQLIYDCGVMVEMDYTEKESGARVFKVPAAMKKHMSYSDQIILLTRASYPVDEWFSIIKNEIDANRVVFYSGDGSIGGHAMICDGYDTDGSKLHMNWGWGGEANGYYTLDFSGINTTYLRNVSFGENHMAIIGMAPDTSTVSHNQTSQLWHYVNSVKYGLTPSRDEDVFEQDMVEGTVLQFKLGWFMNFSNESVTKEYKVCLMDSSGRIRQDGWQGRIRIPAANDMIYSVETQTSKLTVTPELTDYFKLFFKDGSEWVPASQNHELFPDADGMCCGVTPDPIIILPEECSAGQQIKLKLTYGYVPVKTVKWSVNGTEYNAPTLVLEAGTTEIRADVTYYDESEGTIMATVYAK